MTQQNNETLTPQQKANLSELSNMLQYAFEELETDNWCIGEEEIENVCYLRYFIDGYGVYISEQGNIYFDEALPIESFAINSIEDATLLKPDMQMPVHIKERIQQLQELNQRYSESLFTVVSTDNSGSQVAISSEKHQDAYWLLRRDVFDSLTPELVNTLVNESPGSSLKDPVMGI